MHRVVRRLDVLFLIGLLITSGLAAILFWVEFYDKDESTTQLPSVMQVGAAQSTETPLALEATQPAVEHMPTMTATPVPTQAATEPFDVMQTEAVTGEPGVIGAEAVGTPVAVVSTTTLSPVSSTEEAESLPLGEGVGTAEAVDGQGGMTVQDGQTPTSVVALLASPTQEILPSLTTQPMNTPSNTPFPRATVVPVTATFASPVLPTVSGTAEPGDGVELYEDGVLVATATADAQGVWTAMLPEGVDPSSVVVVTIVPGDLSGQGGPLAFDLERTPTVTPSLTFTPWPQASPTVRATAFEVAVGPTATSGVVAVTPTLGATVVAMAPEIDQAEQAEAVASEPEAVIISGTAEPGAGVIITADGEEIGQATADESGAWSFTWVPGAVSEPGEPEPEIEVRPAEGGEALPPESVAVAAAPVIAVPVSGDIVLPGPLAAMGSGQPGATIRLENQTAGTVLGSTTIATSGQWQVRAAMAGEGEQVLLAVMITADGQISQSAPVTVILAQPVHPQTGMDLSRDGEAGRAFAALVALLLAAGGFATYFAGRLVYMLALDRRQAR